MKKSLLTVLLLVVLCLSLVALLFLAYRLSESDTDTTQETEAEICYDAYNFAQYINSLTINFTPFSGSPVTFDFIDNLARDWGEWIGLVRVIGEQEVVTDPAQMPLNFNRPHTLTTVEVVDIFFSGPPQDPMVLFLDKPQLSVGDHLRIRERYYIQGSNLNILFSVPLMTGQEYIVFLNFSRSSIRDADTGQITLKLCELFPNVPMLSDFFPVRDVSEETPFNNIWQAFSRAYGRHHMNLIRGARAKYLG